MKTMEVYRWAIALAAIFTCLQVNAGPGEQPFELNGQLKKVKHGKIYLLQEVSLVERFKNPGAYLHDSAIIKNGKFSFKGAIKGDVVSVYFTMQVPVTEAQRAADPLAGNKTRYFYITGGKIRVAGNDIGDAVFSRNADMGAFMKLDKKLESQRTALYSILSRQLKLSAAGASSGGDTIARYAAQMDSIRKLQADIESAFIIQHPSALINVAILKSRAALAETTTARAISKLVAALSPELRNRPDMLAISKRMKDLFSLVPGNPALQFSLPDTAGNAVTLSSLRGKYVLIEFWASWCGPCRTQVPYLKKSYTAFHDKGFEILGVSLDDNREKWLKAIHEEQLPWLQVSDVKGLESPVVAMYGITGIPLNFLVDTSGVIIARDLRDNELYEKLSALTSQGVQFDHTLSWQQVKAKARAENKYIFMDCYATWCAPCVKMIKEMFPKKEMGDFFNDKFINIKLQLDKTDKDDAYVKSWYKDVEMIQNCYKIPSMPTFLYFSPDGELVHRVPGAEDAEVLIAKSAAALNPDLQYYTLARKFARSDKNDPAMMKLLAVMSRQVMEMDSARMYAKLYINTQQDLLTAENIQFLNRFSSSSDDKGFEVFLNHGDSVDKVLGAGFAQERVRYVIFNEEVLPCLKNIGTSEPDWESITAAVTKKYPAHAGAVVWKFKTQFYLSRGNWRDFRESVMVYMGRYGEGTTDVMALNDFARGVYEHISSSRCVTAALGWSKRAITINNTDPGFMEVYAGLLYKSGRRKEGLAAMEKAVELAADKKSYREVLDRMKRGEPTWMN